VHEAEPHWANPARRRARHPLFGARTKHSNSAALLAVLDSLSHHLERMAEGEPPGKTFTQGDAPSGNPLGPPLGRLAAAPRRNFPT